MALKKEYAMTTEGNTLLVEGPLRSGQRVEFDGNVVVQGDVNPGAEIVATGDVLVFGTLRGMVQSGTAEKEDTVVTALSLLPTQLRLGEHITCPPKNYGKTSSKVPKKAKVTEGKVIIEAI